MTIITRTRTRGESEVGSALASLFAATIFSATFAPTITTIVTDLQSVVDDF